MIKISWEIRVHWQPDLSMLPIIGPYRLYPSLLDEFRCKREFQYPDGGTFHSFSLWPCWL